MKNDVRDFCYQVINMNPSLSDLVKENEKDLLLVSESKFEATYLDQLEEVISNSRDPLICERLRKRKENLQSFIDSPFYFCNLTGMKHIDFYIDPIEGNVFHWEEFT